VEVEVKIYPDLKSFHEFGFGEKDLPDWLVGIANYGDIRSVSPLNSGPVHDYGSILKVIVHEMTHIFIDNIGGKLTHRWLHEGLAGYESGQMNDKRRKDIAERIQLEQIPTFEDMSKDFKEVGGYQFSYTIVEFIIKKYGMEKIIELIKNSTDIQLVLKMNYDEFREKWIEFLKENYLMI
jgi:RNA polymerase sigma-70 factor (ECF subfamily)